MLGWGLGRRTPHKFGEVGKIACDFACPRSWAIRHSVALLLGSRVSLWCAIVKLVFGNFAG